MKSNKRIIAMLLAMVMVLSLAGCGKRETTDSSADSTESKQSTSNEAKSQDTSVKLDPSGDYGGLVPMADADDPITFKVFIRDPGMAPSDDNPVINKIQELTGVTIEYEFLVGDLAQKVGVMIAGEDYPDAIFADSAKFMDAGAYIPLEDMIKDYPNLNAHYGPHVETMKAEDGHMYILELYGVYDNTYPIFRNNGAGFFIQKAVLEEAGYKIPKTLDEYFGMIEDYREKYPTIDGVETIGFEILTDGWRDFCLRNPALHLLGAGNDGNAFVDQSTYTASLYQTTDTAKAYYKKLNEEYHKGIIQAETLVQNYDQYISRISAGSVLGFFDQGWNFGSANNVLKNDGKYDRTYISVPIANPGVQDSYVDSPIVPVTGVNGIGITINCENPERLLGYYDWLLQPEVQDYLNWGVEGVNYVVNEEGNKVLTEEGRAIANDETRRRDEGGYVIGNYSPKRQGLYDDGTPTAPRYSEDEYLASLSEYDQEFLKAFGVKYDAELMSAPAQRADYYPVWAMSIEEGSPAKVAENKFVDICREYYPQLILADPEDYDALWDEFVGEFDDSNYEAYLAEIQRQIDAAMNK